jgi:erythromycin esterase
LKEGELDYKLEKSSDLDPLFEQIAGNVKYVLLGEALHGTSEFYSWRTEISKGLITERKFWFIDKELPETFPTGL